MQHLSNDVSWSISLNFIPFGILQVHSEWRSPERQFSQYKAYFATLHSFWQAHNSKWRKKGNVL